MNHLFKKKLFFSLCLISVLSACGKEARWEATSPAGAENLISSAGGNAYRTSAAISYQTSSGNSALLPAGTNVTILETRKDPELGDLVHLGVDSDDAKLPSEIWLKAKEIEAAGLEALQETDLNGDAEGIDFFEDVRSRGGMTYCFRYVKVYLQKKGLVRGYLPGKSAYMAAPVLQQRGWYRISGGAENAQVNDVCVYRGGRGGNGHVEVRVPGGWYYGYGIKVKPIERTNHPFIGCYRK